MKKSILLFTIIWVFLFIPVAKSSHVAGGEISWKCMSNGKYVFYMNIYRDCTGSSWNFSSKFLEVFGNSLPKDSNNVSLDSIELLADSSKWSLYRNGDITPECEPANPYNSLRCKYQDLGTIQAFFYESEPIMLKGTPPTSGWHFVFSPGCCRSFVENMTTTGNPIFRAIMFADKDSSNVDSCFDSSPEFQSPPRSGMCLSNLIEYNNSAYDADLDSLVYAWDRTYDAPAKNPVRVAYKKGYAYDNPTPDKSFDSLNIPATLDTITGAIQFAVFSGGSAPKKYLSVIRIDSYRCGHKISSVFREIPWVFFSCVPLPKDSNNQSKENRGPDFFVNGKRSSDTIIDVLAGQKVNIPLQATDYDFAGSQNNGLQRIRMSTEGYLFSNDLSSTNNCTTAALAPCAIIQNQSASLNTLFSPPTMGISGNAAISTEFSWETGCQHLPKNCKGDKVKSTNFNFVFNIQDDNCPVPGQTSATITIRLNQPVTLLAPIMKGASVGLDGRVTYQWIPPLDSAKVFSHYRSAYASPTNNQAPTNYQLLDSNLNKYGFENTDTNKQVQVYSTNTNNKVNILQKVANKDWFFRILTNAKFSY